MLTEAERDRLKDYLALGEVRAEAAAAIEVNNMASTSPWHDDQEFETAVGALGFTTEKRTVSAFGSGGGGGALEMVELAIKHGPTVAAVAVTGVVGLNGFIKAALELPSNMGKLLALIKRKRIDPGPAFDFVYISSWLDGKYGGHNWTYDPDAVRVVRTPASFIYLLNIFMAGAREPRVGRMHVVTVKDGAVTELPPEWAKNQVEDA